MSRSVSISDGTPALPPTATATHQINLEINIDTNTPPVSLIFSLGFWIVNYLLCPGAEVLRGGVGWGGEGGVHWGGEILRGGWMDASGCFDLVLVLVGVLVMVGGG